MNLRKMRDDRKGIMWVMWGIVAVLIVVLLIVTGLYLAFINDEKPPVKPEDAYGYIDYSLRLQCTKVFGGSNSFDFMTPPDTLRFVKSEYSGTPTTSMLDWVNGGVQDGMRMLGWFDSSMTIEVKTRIQCFPAGYDFLLTSQQSVSWGMDGVQTLTWVPDVLVWCGAPGVYSITWEAYDKSYGNMLAQDTASITVPPK